MNDSTREPSHASSVSIGDPLPGVKPTEPQTLVRVRARPQASRPPMSPPPPKRRNVRPPSGVSPAALYRYQTEQERGSPSQPSSTTKVVSEPASDKIETLTDRVSATSETPPSDPPVTKSPGKRRLLRWFLLFAIPLAILLAAAWFYIHGGRYVTTENAYVKANIIAISADISGRVTDVQVTDNQFVEAGTLLFAMDTAPYLIEIAEAEAQMAVALTDIEALRADYRETQVSIEEAKEQKSHLDKELDRQQTMVNRGIGTSKDLDLAQHDAVMAQRRLNTQQARARQALASLSGDARIKPEKHPRYLRALASKQQTENTMSKARIFAPSSGIVSNMKLQTGEYVEDGKAVFSLIETSPLWVEANLKETQLTHLVEGQVATFVADAYPNVSWSAAIETIAPATGAEFSLLPPQNATGNWVKVVQRVPVRLAIGQPVVEAEGRLPVLRAGMTVAVSIDTGYERSLPTPLEDLVNSLPLPEVVRSWIVPSSHTVSATVNE